jgi:hypothetical protein
LSLKKLGATLRNRKSMKKGTRDGH